MLEEDLVLVAEQKSPYTATRRVDQYTLAREQNGLFSLRVKGVVKL